MNRFAKQIYHVNAKIYAAFVFLICLALSSVVVIHLEKAEVRQFKERAQQAALIQSSRIQQTMDDILYTAQTLRVFLEQENGSIENFTSIAASVIKDYPIYNIALAPGGVVSQVYPYAGNEAAMGHDLLRDPARATEAITARNSREYTLTGPYELKQGGVGVIGRLPIYLKDNNREEFFWGFVCITLMLPDAFEDIAMERLENLNYAYEVWRINPETNSKQIIMASPKPILYETQDAAISLPNSTWYLSLAPVSGWMNQQRLILWKIIAIGLSLLISMVFYFTWALNLKKLELDFNIRQQAANYERMNQLNQELRIFKHDMNNHLLSLSDLIKHYEYEGAGEYLTSMSSLLVSTGRFVNTENYVFDALLSQKLEAAKQKGIRTETEISIPKQLKILNTDWSTLFGNALDNAIEACESMEEGHRKIIVYVRYTGDMLKVRISNSAASAPILYERRFLTTKQDTVHHGIGMSSIAAVVKKYHGEMDTDYKNGMFSLSFVLLHV